MPLRLNSHFFRFLCAGSFNTLFGYGLYWLLLIILPYPAAYTVSYLTGVAMSYLLNCWFVFRRKPSWRSAIRFPLVYVVQYPLGLGLLALFIERFHWDRRVAALGVICCSVPITFVLSRLVLSGSPALRSPHEN
jgi:putative flippase GtrA